MSRNLIDVVGEFCTALRMGEGIDEHQLAQLRELLLELQREWPTQDFVPRESAGVLAELAPAMEAASYLYAGEQGERIRELAAELSGEVSAVFFGQP